MDGSVQTAQEEFDRTYITSTEICAELGVTRSTVLSGNKRGLLPEPIRINRPAQGAHIVLWKRETVRPFLAAWKIALQSRRGELA